MRAQTIKVDEKVMAIIIKQLQRVGVTANLKGYEYLKSGISILLEDPSTINRITKVLYPSIAKEHGATVSGVERGIRHAIECVFSRNPGDDMEELLGGCVNSYTGKTTNSEFLSIMAENVRLEVGAYGRAN